MGLKIHVLKASTSREIDAAFANFVRERPDALFVGNDAFLTSRRVQLVHLATLHRLPATYALRDYAEVGGLMSYGASLRDAYRQVGSMPAASSRAPSRRTCRSCRRGKFELVINLQNGEIARPHRTADAARDGRRGDRVGLASANAFCCTCSRQLLAQSGGEP